MGCCCPKFSETSKGTDKSKNLVMEHKNSPTQRSPTGHRHKDRTRRAKDQAQNAEANTGVKLIEPKTEDMEVEIKRMVDNNKAEKEGKTVVKDGTSAYGKQKTNKEHKKKALSASNYNRKGLVDKQSKEFAIVRDYLKTKHCQLIESIGSGNYAEVYKAFMPSRNRFVAVKVIDLTKTNDNYRLDFLKKEISILKTLKHPWIIKHYDVSQNNKRIYMIMEFCSYGTVTDWLRDRGAFSEPIAWEMDTRILEGIHYMHSNLIAHRDLKLENILITERGEPRISDFSYAVVVDENEINSTTFCGSIPYFAPEILQRKPHNPLPSDVWALGICFYVMVCDGLPFRIDDEKQMLAKQLDRDWDFKKKYRNKLSNEFKQMIRDMLEPDVDRRATTEQLINCPWIKNKPNSSE